MLIISEIPSQKSTAWALPAPTIDPVVARTPSTFKQADLVRAVKAARAAGLPVTATQITRDGTIQLIHTEKTALPLSDYDRFEADL